MEENISQPEKEFSPSLSQTIPNPKPKFSPILTGILLLVLGGVGGFLLGRQSLQPKSTTTTQVTPLPSEAPVEERVTETPSAIPTLDPTAEWKTYIDTNNTFSFRYPADWILNEDKEISLKKSDPSQEKVLLPGEKKEEASYQITLSIENNPKELSAKDFYLANFAPENKAQAKSKLQELDIAGQKAILYDEGAAPSSGLSKTAALSYKGKIYRFTYGAMAHEDTHLKFYPIFNLILSTFKFLD